MSNYSSDTFDPSHCTKEEMKFLAEHINAYLELLKNVMIIPEEILKERGKDIQEGIKRTEKLIAKLRKGDKSVFKDEDEWNSIM